MNTESRAAMPVPTTEQPVLPEPAYPWITLMISNSVFPRKPDPKTMACPHCKGSIAVPDVSKDKKEEPEPIFWLLSKPHPFVPDMKIVRMFRVRDVVNVYSVSSDEKVGMRDRVPMQSVRLLEDGMPFDVFVEEMEDDEDYNPADDRLVMIETEEPEEPDPAAQTQPSAPTVNVPVS